VWALNQLSDRDPSGVQDLLSAGAELRAAQQATLSSPAAGADRLRSAGADRRAAVSRLAGVAGDMLEGAGRGGRPDEIASALEAASVDEAAGERLAAGTLERLPPTAAGFGDVFGLTAIDGGADEEDATDAPGPASRGRRASGSDRQSDAERAEAEGAVARLRRDRDAAERRAKTAREAVRRLAVRVEGMRERLAAAEAERADADARAGGTELELARVERDLAAATERLKARSRDR
jgi:hypothetical protein